MDSLPSGAVCLPLARSADNSHVLATLKRIDHWLGWRHEEQLDRQGNVVHKKPPISAHTGRKCDGTAPANYASHAVAVQFAVEHGLDGVGFGLTAALGIVAIDLDDCYDPITDRIADWAQEVLDLLGDPLLYVEISPSGTGLRLFFRGRIPDGFRCTVPVMRDGKKIGKIEAYQDERYVTVTENRLPGTAEDVTEGGERLLRFVERYLAPKPATPPTTAAIPTPEGTPPGLPVRETPLPTAWVIEQVRRNAKSGPWFAGDMTGCDSQSEAELRLCGAAIYWCWGDADQVDAVIRASKLFRDKWDERHGDASYGRRTIRFAMETYDGHLYRGKGPKTGSEASPPPLRPPHCEYKCPISRKSDRHEHRLVAYVREKRQHLGCPVGLSARTAAAVLGVGKSTANRVMQRVEEKKSLVVVERGTYTSGLATVYELPEYAHLLPTKSAPAVETVAAVPPDAVAVAAVTAADDRQPVAGKPSARPTFLPPRPVCPREAVTIWVWGAARGRWRNVGTVPVESADVAWTQTKKQFRNASYFVVGEMFYERQWENGRGRISLSKIGPAWAVPRPGQMAPLGKKATARKKSKVRPQTVSGGRRQAIADYLAANTVAAPNVCP